MSTRVQDSSLAALLLVSRLVDTDAAPLKSSEFWPLLERVGDPARLLGEDATGLSSMVGPKLDVGRLAALLDRGTGLAFELDKLQQMGVRTVSAVEEDYPPRLRARLKSGAPPFLHVAGPVELLQEDGLGIVGSRNVSAAGAEVAREAAREGVRNGMPIVSGGARGVDQLAMSAAHEAGGQVVGVLADSLQKAVKSSDTRRALSEGTACLCTPYKPDAPFNAGNAMGRNRIIYGLSSVVFVVASDLESGGTWAGASDALKNGWSKVAVWRGEGGGPGNGALEQMGGRPLNSTSKLFESVGTALDAGESQPAQASLDI